VEDGVHTVAEDFFRVGGTKLAGLDHGYGRAYVAFAGEFHRRGVISVVEGNDVGAALMLEEVLVDMGHPVFPDEVYSKFKGRQAEVMIEEPEQYFTELRQVDLWQVVALADLEDPVGFRR
jgi:hypothetical protein